MLFREAENRGIDCRLFGFIMDSEDGDGYYDLIDGYIVALGEGSAEMEIPISRAHLNPQETVHGGLMCSLLDSVMGISMKTLDKVGVTANVNVNFLKKAQARDTLTGKGKIVKNGNKLIYAEGQIVNQRNELIATAQGTFYVMGEFLAPYIEKIQKEQQEQQD